MIIKTLNHQYSSIAKLVVHKWLGLEKCPFSNCSDLTAAHCTTVARATCLPRSSAFSIGVIILSTVRKAARLAVYELDNYHEKMLILYGIIIDKIVNK